MDSVLISRLLNVIDANGDVNNLEKSSHHISPKLSSLLQSNDPDFHNPNEASSSSNRFNLRIRISIAALSDQGFDYEAEIIEAISEAIEAHDVKEVGNVMYDNIIVRMTWVVSAYPVNLKDSDGECDRLETTFDRLLIDDFENDPAYHSVLNEIKNASCQYSDPDVYLELLFHIPVQTNA